MYKVEKLNELAKVVAEKRAENAALEPRRMTAEEKEAVPYMILTNQLISTAWFADKDRYRNQYETNLKMTRWIIRNFDRLKL